LFKVDRMPDYIFKIGPQTFTIRDLGNTMNQQFLMLHESHFLNHVFDFNKFKEDSFDFFDHNTNFAVHDGYFNNFTIIWRNFLNQGLFKKAEEIWNQALGIAYEWETARGRLLHKGTPFYFLGVTYVLDGDLTKGFLLMHQALEEDKRTHNTDHPDTPAYAFVTLNYRKAEQFFRFKVEEISGFLSEKINIYCSQRGSHLSLDDFKSKFLENTDLQDVVFLFVYSLFELKKLFDTDERLTQNVFSSLLDTNIIFNLCSFIDRTINNINPNQGRLTLYDQLVYLSSQATLAINGNKLREINKDRDTNFSGTLNDILQSRYSFDDGYSPTPIETDIMTTYFFRNFAAHKIENQPTIYQNFKEIIERILNTLFFSVETLY